MEALRLRGFGFAYPGEVPVFENLDLAVERGAFALLVGKTGSGKTTLLKCCKQEIAPVGTRWGSVEVLGCMPDGEGARAKALAVGYVFQNPENQIVCDTVLHELAFGLENLGVDPDAMRRRVAEAAAFFGIEPWLHAETARLSGGQKQLVNLAGILAMQPQLLLLDEPTAQLDPIAEKNFLHALFRMNRELGITVVVATHAPESMTDYATEAFELNGEDGIERIPLDGLSGRPMGKGAANARRTAEGAAASPRLDGKPCIVCSDAFFRYARDRAWVLRGADLRVRAGAIHVLVGGNGSGKSTMLRLVAGVLEPERGRVENGLRRRQALLPQDPKALFVCDSVLDELREWQKACGFDDAAVDAAAERFGLADALGRHPFDLSGGQQQGLAFAKLLLTGPDLLLLDEPTKGLDAPSKVALARELERLRDRGATIVVATHDLSFASVLADELSMLFDGEVVSTEPTEAFFSHNLFYRYREDGFLRAWAASSSDGGCI